MDVKRQVLAFFESKGGIPGATEEERLKCGYLDTRVIDSMGIVSMVLEFEATFGIRFSPAEMQSLEFRTVGGLISLIERMQKEQGRG